MSRCPNVSRVLRQHYRGTSIVCFISCNTSSCRHESCVVRYNYACVLSAEAEVMSELLSAEAELLSAEAELLRYKHSKLMINKTVKYQV